MKCMRLKGVRLRALACPQTLIFGRPKATQTDQGTTTSERVHLVRDPYSPTPLQEIVTSGGVSAGRGPVRTLREGQLETTHANAYRVGHYHTKHCHAAVVSLGGLTHR